MDNDYIHPPPYHPLLLLRPSSSLFCACLPSFHFGPDPVTTNPKTTYLNVIEIYSTSHYVWDIKFYHNVYSLFSTGKSEQALCVEVNDY